MAIICCVAMGGWYHMGLARLIQKFHEVSPGHKIVATCNLPERTIDGLYTDKSGYNYAPYAMKPHMLMRAIQQAPDDEVVILVDAAFYPIRNIEPLVEHIRQVGYYFCRNGNTVGEWSSDRCLLEFDLSREDAMAIPEVSSYCVGYCKRKDRPHMDWPMQWTVASTPAAICGPHTATGHPGRNQGFVSHDPRVRGHRHDQTVLSIIAHRLDMTELVERPRMTAYLGHETEETVLVNNGGCW